MRKRNQDQARSWASWAMPVWENQDSCSNLKINCPRVKSSILRAGASISAVPWPYLPILDILRSYFEIKEGDQEYLIKKNMEEKILQLDEKLHGVLSPFHELLSLEVEDEAYQKLDPHAKKGEDL